MWVYKQNKTDEDYVIPLLSHSLCPPSSLSPNPAEFLALGRPPSHSALTISAPASVFNGSQSHPQSSSSLPLRETRANLQGWGETQLGVSLVSGQPPLQVLRCLGFCKASELWEWGGEGEGHRETQQDMWLETRSCSS